MSTDFTEKVSDPSRRKLLKKAYVAPALVVLGSMTFTPTVEAMSSKGGSGGGSHSGGSTKNFSRTVSHSSSSSLRPKRRDNGWGNGDQGAPGHSGPHNNAENDQGGKIHRNHGPSNSN